MSDDDQIASTMTAGQNLMEAREEFARIESQIEQARAMHENIHRTMEWFTETNPSVPDYVAKAVIFSVDSTHEAVSSTLQLLEFMRVEAAIKVAEYEAAFAGMEAE